MTTQPHMSGVTDSADEISGHECRAMRALDADSDYTRSEIAFMFETQVPTVTQHADRECRHQSVLSGGQLSPKQRYTDVELLDAFREVYDKQSYERMSQATYDRNRPDDSPAATTIQRRFGSWPEARERAHKQ